MTKQIENCDFWQKYRFSWQRIMFFFNFFTKIFCFCFLLFQNIAFLFTSFLWFKHTERKTDRQTDNFMYLRFWHTNHKQTDPQTQTFALSFCSIYSFGMWWKCYINTDYLLVQSIVSAALQCITFPLGTLSIDVREAWCVSFGCSNGHITPVTTITAVNLYTIVKELNINQISVYNGG